MMWNLTPKHLALIAAAGSAALLLGALGFQALGFDPCQLCLWQRWPHLVAVVAGGLVLIWGTAWPILAIGGVGALTSAGIAGFHTGVERKWWAGLDSCSGDIGGLTGDLLSTDAPRVVPCDEIPWDLFGISMANFNLVLSLCLAVIWLVAALLATGAVTRR